MRWSLADSLIQFLRAGRGGGDRGGRLREGVPGLPPRRRGGGEGGAARRRRVSRHHQGARPPGGEALLAAQTSGKRARKNLSSTPWTDQSVGRD